MATAPEDGIADSATARAARETSLHLWRTSGPDDQLADLLVQEFAGRLPALMSTCGRDSHRRARPPHALTGRRLLMPGRVSPC